MRKVWRGEAVEGLVESIGVIIFLGVLCGWPWWKTAALPKNFYVRQYVFAMLALGIACAFVVPIATGSDFMIGLQTIFCVLCIWAAYPLTKLVRAAPKLWN